jgi:hypothetical protein
VRRCLVRPRDAGLRIDHLLLSPSSPDACSIQGSTGRFEAGKSPSRTDLG